MSELDFNDDWHPIDMVERIAMESDWDFDRMNDDQIAMAIESPWKTYSITFVLLRHKQTLRMLCTYEMKPPEDKLPLLYELLNKVNDQSWSGHFSYWADEKLMVFRYGLLLTGTNSASPELINTMLQRALAESEQYYPAISLVIWGETPPEEAIERAIGRTYGRA